MKAITALDTLATLNAQQTDAAAQALGAPAPPQHAAVEVERDHTARQGIDHVPVKDAAIARAGDAAQGDRLVFHAAGTTVLAWQAAPTTPTHGIDLSAIDPADAEARAVKRWAIRALIDAARHPEREVHFRLMLEREGTLVLFGGFFVFWAIQLMGH